MPLILAYHGQQPQIAPDAFIAPTAVLIGAVTVGAGANIWYGAVLRGDSGRITIGPRVSVQDNVVIHVNPQHDTWVGEDVTIGHGAVLEGCHIEAGALIGMQATLLSGSQIGAGALVAAGAVVLEGGVVPAGMLAAGAPAQIKGPLSAQAQARVAAAAREYSVYAARHRQALQAAGEDATPGRQTRTLNDTT